MRPIRRKKGNNKNRWYPQRMEFEGERVELREALALNGVIYIRSLPRALPKKEILFSLKFVDDDASNPFTLTHFELEEVKLSHSHHLCSWFSCLVDSCGSIYLIQGGFHNYDGAHAAKVWELDLQQRTWVEVKCLGDRAFFICCGNAARGWAISTGHSKSSRGIEANCLYIYNVEMGKGGVVMYSLKDCSSTLLPCGTDNTWREFVFWVMPQHLWFEEGQGGQNLLNVKDSNVSKSCLTVGTTECKQLLLQKEPQEERLSELPRDLIELLSRYMHLFDYWNFRCTSKLIQSATPLPLWRTNNLFPLFLVFEDDGGLCRVMDPCRDDFRSCIFPLYGDNHFDILYSKDGWLLVSDTITVQFFNPFTRERGDLPDLCELWYNSIGFSTNPTCSKCLTVSISGHYTESEMIINYFRFGDSKWTPQALENSYPSYFEVPSGSPIYHSGAFYWLFTNGHLGVLEMADEDSSSSWSWRVYDSPVSEDLKLYSCYLVECGQSLVSVFFINSGKDVKVFRFKQTDKSWVDVPSLGNYTLFLKSNSSTSVATSNPKMKNRIYLPLIQGNHIVYYSLETKQYYVNNTEVTSNDISFNKFSSRSCWI